MSTYVVGVSGGVDSVALLHMLKNLPDRELIVAHVDHGIRPDSHEDALFVRRMAELWGLPFETIRYELGPGASEEQAREARYRFLHDVARRHDATLVTAHHGDDVVETVAINVHRGTGWRGLATHSAAVERPLLKYTKAQLHEYARLHGLEWREDSTNQSMAYLRNRIRQHVATMSPDTKRQLLELRQQQLQYARAIRQEVISLVGPGPEYSRYFFTHIPRSVAIECLRHIVDGKLTRPQLDRALLAIKTSLPGKTYEAGTGVRLHFTTRNFSLSLIK